MTRKGPDIAYTNHRPFRTAETPEELGVPFTVRAHSFDTLSLRRKSWKGRARQMFKEVVRRQPPLERTPWFQEGLRWMRDERCLGVLAFPFTRPWHERVGAPGDKIIDCWPVVDVGSFEDRSPNGPDVMNTGVATPKKKMDDFIELATKTPGPAYRLYAMGYEIDDLRKLDRRHGGSIEFVEPIQPEQMPAEYKRHQWLVYTADFDIPTVGWPMAIAEAQAAGVGVCMPRIRPDLAEYVGPGVLYDSIDEVSDIVTKPVPDEMRDAGFEHARRSDIARHKHLLTDLWDTALSGMAISS